MALLGGVLMVLVGLDRLLDDGTPAAAPLDLAVSEVTVAGTAPAAPEGDGTGVPGAGDGSGGASIEADQYYVVQPGDFADDVAQRFAISVDELGAVNGGGDPEREFPWPGEAILIPVGARRLGEPLPDPDAPPAPVDEAAGPGGDGADDGDGDGEGGLPELPVDLRPQTIECPPLQHVINVGDLPIIVAREYGITLESLIAENADNDDFQSFVVGRVIFIPQDCG